MALRAVGNFRELRHGAKDGPSIEDREHYEAATKSLLMDYLASAPVLVASGSIAVDHFDGEVIGSLSLQTDGQWVWYSDLANYLDKWDVRIESEFVNHVLSADLADLDSIDLEAAQERFFE